MRPTDARYRPDIDGLRTLAVLAVLIFHAYPARLTGGFVGVDVFFVISGFLIGGILMRGLDAGTFSFRTFYARRIRRIFPALILVLLTTLAFGWFILLPDEYVTLGKHSVTGALFTSNFRLWSEAGYFDASADQKPLLHLWSLGIEEQFYLFWPLILCALYKLKRHPSTLIAVLAVASFAFDQYLVSQQSIAGFYSPLARIWELLVGALLAAHPALLEKLPRGLRQPLAIVGTACIVAAMVIYTKSTSFPGVAALLPVLGAAAIIAAGPAAWVNRFAFASKPAVWVGLISYPLYLWHWPLIVYARMEGMRHGILMALGLSFVLAALTYLLVERPLQQGNLRKVALRLFALLLLPIAAACAIIFTDGAPHRAANKDGELLEIRRAEEAAYPTSYREETCFLKPDQGPDQFKPECTAKGRPTVFLWGDSHAAHLYPGLRHWVPNAATAISQYNASACPPVLGFVSKDRPRCKSINDAILPKLAVQKPDILILSASWNAYYQQPAFLPQLAATIHRVRSSAKRIVLVGPGVIFNEPQLKLALKAKDVSDVPNPALPGLRDADAALRRVAAQEHISYVSPISELCHEQGCAVILTQDGNRALLAWDLSHLTRAGSEYYVRHLLNPLLKLRTSPPADLSPSP